MQKKSPSAKQSFFYIPLKPIIVNNSGNINPKRVQLLNIRKFLLVSNMNGSFEFTEAYYILDTTNNNESHSKKFFKNFTETLTAISLDAANRSCGYKYKNGVVMKLRNTDPIKVSAFIEVPTTGRTEWKCRTIYVCNYYANCNNYDDIIVTSTMNEGYCEYPSEPPNCTTIDQGHFFIYYRDTKYYNGVQEKPNFY